MIPDEHDGDLLPGREQLQAQVRGAPDEPLVRVRVQPVALLEDALVDGRGGQVGSVVGRGAALDAAGHVAEEHLESI